MFAIASDVIKLPDETPTERERRLAQLQWTTVVNNLRLSPDFTAKLKSRRKSTAKRKNTARHGGDGKRGHTEVSDQVEAPAHVEEIAL